MTGMATSFVLRKVCAGFILVGLRGFREVAATISEPWVSGVHLKPHVDCSLRGGSLMALKVPKDGTKIPALFAGCKDAQLHATTKIDTE